LFHAHPVVSVKGERRRKTQDKDRRLMLLEY
jgi:hypothetical protein